MLLKPGMTVLARSLSPDKAIKAWNTLPRRLRWTKAAAERSGVVLVETR